MIIKVKYGFDYNSILYGWIEKKLYRMPQNINKRFYPLKELQLIDVGKSRGYLISRSRKSLKQLEDMTIFINFEYQKIESEDVPF